MHMPVHPLAYKLDGGWEDIKVHHNREKAGAMVTLINPAMMKGFPILKALAAALPGVQFAGVESWGVTPGVAREIAEMGNCVLLPSTHDMESVWEKVSVLIVPSLWQEAFGLVVVEAMLRGIPVLSSDVGGLSEAHLGVPHVLPVTSITGQREQDVDRSRDWGPYVVPQQQEDHVRLWGSTLLWLLVDKNRYDRVAEQGRSAALSYCELERSSTHETWLQGLRRHAARG